MQTIPLPITFLIILKQMPQNVIYVMVFCTNSIDITCSLIEGSLFHVLMKNLMLLQDVPSSRVHKRDV